MSVSKDRIADVFAKHVERYGYRKTTLDEVARDLGISKKTLYVHFEGKREIYAYIVERLAARNRVELAAAVAPLPSNTEKVMAIVRMTLQQARAHVVETAEADWRQEYEVAADAFTQATGSLLTQLVGDGIEAGEFVVEDAVFSVRMLTAMVLEYVLMMREDPSLERDGEMAAGIRRYLGAPTAG